MFAIVLVEMKAKLQDKFRIYLLYYDAHQGRIIEETTALGAISA